MARIPEITLDDRSFQDLVNEARLRLSQRCPEWTEHNVSDPGITLVELFAWLTESIIYRLNRVPEKLHVTLLDLLGIQIAPPVAATTRLRFRLAGPVDEPVHIPAGETEVGTIRTTNEEAVIFQTSEDFTIPPARPIAYAVKRGGAVKDVGVATGVAKPKGADQAAFGTPPKAGDALYIGFDVSLANMLLEIDVDCSTARGAGVDPEDPPLRWEVSDAEEETGWLEAEVIEDLTGGFNYGAGKVTIQLPDRHTAVPIAGHRGYWVCCRLDTKTRSGEAGGASYTHPPEIRTITAAPIGAIIPAAHSARETEEVVGSSDGTPGQSFELRYYPVLEPTSDEHLEVLDPEVGTWERWDLVESFVESKANAKHYVLNLAAGQIEFGPAIRTPDGNWKQYGGVPPKSATLRFSRYRHGGGRDGNVAPGTLTVLKSAIPGVDTVTNLRPAFGGVDPEALESARTRAAMEIRTRYRAVTTEDFEFLCGEASPRVARAVCVPPGEDGMLRVHILPMVAPADRQLSVDELSPDEPLLTEVAEYLDERRLIGTTMELLPVKLRGVSVVVNLQASHNADLERVEQDVAYALYTYLNPLVGGSTEGLGEGWEFGRSLNQGELYGIVRSIEGVEFIKILRVYETDLETGKQDPKPAGSYIEIGPDEVIASGSHIIKAERPEI
jgi:predicted phage baseplate assembly protein